MIEDEDTETAAEKKRTQSSEVESVIDHQPVCRVLASVNQIN